MISDHGRFRSHEGQQGMANGQRFVGRFSGMYIALNCWVLARASALPPQGPHHLEPRYFNFLYFYLACGHERLGLVDQT